MHDAKVRLKDGRTYCGPIWAWCPSEGWFSLTDAEENLVKIQLADVAEASKIERLDVGGREEEVDLLERARKDGWKE